MKGRKTFKKTKNQHLSKKTRICRKNNEAD
jgi:hypothetical protein